MFDSLTKEAADVLKRSFAWKGGEVMWQHPREIERGDVSTNIALVIAKDLKKKPMEIAEELAKGLSASLDVEKVEPIVPGYVNVWLKPAVLLQNLTETVTATRPAKLRKKEKPVVIDYSAPNIAKPLGIHHIMSTIIGQALANLYRHQGYPTVADNHLGDWGTQFGKLAVAQKLWGKKKSSEYTLDALLALYVQFHDEAAKNPALEEEARVAFAALEKGDAQLQAFWEDVVRISKDALQVTYDRLGVSFDEELGESFYEDKMVAIIDEGKAKGVFTVGKEGALIVEFPENENVPPYLVLKGDGSTLYSTRDLATIRYRLDRWHPSEILYVVDVAQSLHFTQLFATVQKLGWDCPLLEHVVFGRMRFKDSSMSTRKGNILSLEQVLDEAVLRADKVIEEHRETIQTDDRKELADMMGIGALVYGILSQNRKIDIVFDWDKVLSFEGNSAPYLQYTHARACSVLRKGEVEEGMTLRDVEALADSERLLLRTLLLYPAVLEDARDTRMPHKLANFLYQLSQDFNAFYNKEPILKAEGEQREFRLGLTQISASVLRSGANILTLRMPERM